jgi:Holliday junction resolvase RusA-like endonuclease
MIRLFFPIKPVPKQRPRMSRYGNVFTPQKTKLFERTIQVMARKQFRQFPLIGPLQVAMTFFLPKPRTSRNEFPVVKGDIDNFFKSASDAMNGCVWVDDAQICGIFAKKIYASPDQEIGILVEISRFTG